MYGNTGFVDSKSEEALSKDEIFFAVRKVTSDLVIDIPIASNLTHCVLGYPPSNDFRKKILGFCTGKYNLVPIAAIVAPMEQAFGKANLAYDVRYKNIDDRIICIDYIFKTVQSKTKKVGDIMSPMVSLMHSYSGEVSFQLNMSCKRLVCANGMTIPVAQDKIKRKYTLGLTPEFLSEAIDSVMNFLHSFSDILKVFKVLEERKLTTHEVRILQEDIKEKSDFSPRLLLPSLEVAYQELERLRNPSMDAWTLYNGFNYQLNHHSDTPDITKLAIDRQLQSIFYETVN